MWGNEEDALREGSSEAAAVCNTARSNDHDWLAGQRALGVLADVDTRGDQHSEWRVTGVSTSLSTLCADDVNACAMQLVKDRISCSKTSVDQPCSSAFLTC